MNGNGNGNNAPQHFKDAAQIKEGTLETAEEKIKRLQRQNEFLTKRIDHLVSLEKGGKWVTELENLRGAQVVAANVAEEHKREIRGFRAEMYDLRFALEEILADLKRRKPNLLTIRKEIGAMVRALTLRINFPHPGEAVHYTEEYHGREEMGTESGKVHRAAGHGRKPASRARRAGGRDDRKKSAGKRKGAGKKNP